MAYDLTNRFSVAFLLVTAVLWALAALALRHRDRRGPRLLAVVLVAMSLWSFGDAVRIGAPGRASILLWDRVADAGIIFLAPAIFFFVAYYTGKHRWLQRKYVAALFLTSGAFLAVAATNPLHGLWASVEGIDPRTPPPVFIEGRGLVWYAFAIYGPALAAASYYLIFTKMAEEERAEVYRSQALLIGIGILTPILLTSFYLLGIVPYDPTPFGFLVTGVTFAVAIYRYDLFDVAPVARDTVVSTTDSGVLVVDRDGRVADANDAFSEMVGVPVAELVGRSLSALRSDHPQLLDGVGDARDAGETVTVRTDGERRHYDVTVSPIRTAVDADAGRVVVFNDVTETVRRRNELLERTAELERQNERLDRFAGMVSHDLRNPLQVAEGRLDLAAERGDEADFDAVRDAHDRMDAMIDDLLTMARAGQTVDDTEPVAVATLVRESWAHTETDGAVLAVDGPDDWTVDADPDRLRHVFENLFRNAVEHNDPPLTVRVGTIETTSTTGDGRPVGFFVEDDGAGIPAERRDDVLEHGYTTGENGTGFGLAVVTEVVHAHGWNIEVDESSAGGARFEVYTDEPPETGPDG